MNVKKYLLIIASSMTIASVNQVAAQQDVRGVKLKSEATTIFDEKCLACHNRQLIDDALKERREMDQVLRSMEKRGVFLTDREKKVIGHFWGQKMFKGEEKEELRNK